jgi:hypothetical protein
MTTPVYENHKWVKMLQVLLAILAGGFVSRIATSGSWRRIRAALLLVALLTVPGGIEAIPFIHGGPQVRYAEYPRGVVAAVRENTSPRAVLVSQFTREILLAGRKVYVTNRKDVSGVFPYLSGTGFRIPLRTRYNELLFKSPSIEEFCRNIRVMKVDVVEFSEGNRSTVLYSLVKTWPSFSARNQRMKQDVVFVHTTPCSGNL